MGGGYGEIGTAAAAGIISSGGGGVGLFGLFFLLCLPCLKFIEDGFKVDGERNEFRR